ncbi:MAG TPA: tyrosine-type recombinase/integrase [Blastocatellia bacterium]|nr:tyrosine-type recombinase/integrase [Blastocatellia bacterium]
MSRRTGQIIRRGDKRWLVRIYTGTDADGKRHYHNKTVHGLKKDAEEWLMKALRRIQLGEPLEDSTDTFAAYFSDWLRHRAQQLRRKTIEQYQTVADYYLLPAFGKKRLTDITAEAVQRHYTGLVEQGLSGGTIRLAHSILSGCLKQALRQRKIRRNPLEGVIAPKVTHRKMKALTVEQVQALRRTVAEDSFGSLFLFLLATGCRPGEALALRWSDINWQARTLTIQRSLTWLKSGEYVFTDPKTASGRRTIPLAEGLHSFLTDHRRTQQEARMKAGSAWQHYDLVFCDEAGGPVPQQRTRSSFKRILAAAGLPQEIRVYDLRHSAASLLMAAGINPKVVSERLGHANISITLQTYSHVSPGLQESASETLEEAIFT